MLYWYKCIQFIPFIIFNEQKLVLGLAHVKVKVKVKVKAEAKVKVKVKS